MPSHCDQVPLYLPHHAHPPAQRWNPADFTNVDDTVRGGKSSSNVSLVANTGELEFSGNLDITALGGAGFASQANDHGFPVRLDKARFDGLRLRVRRQDPRSPPRRVQASSLTASTSSPPAPQPGNVTRYVVNIKTQAPTTRPDGRRQSSLVWEWDIQLPCHDPNSCTPDGATLPRTDLVDDDGDGDAFWTFDAHWSDFKPTYRGRPAEDPGEFLPQETHEWSIMARSNFGKQAGEFALTIHSLSAIVHAPTAPAPSQQSPSKRHLDLDLVDMEKAAALPSSTSSGEYYGFALFIFATVLYLVWTVWGLTPDWALQKVGVAWYPNRCVDAGAQTKA
ncbi:uncharacterized protein PFL1_02995 [Pseudozyma flocculosa PF-1]|uniref:NADH:ubiquinone oxidoreductase intermediate-associated protein 30 domain-containing protein n=1 Tax=Pseudozyma flocculosa PF-1 TaxID=1277687 RepID=A0A061HB30_9BASI|nr:uncharacterized protein PFL1_02995 [Pseudozyma flocculosa PF-1]EPQ29240.1 hypothetical protein PFL1_02995 [Pseudozyma flocculosa PF-1]